MRAQQAPPQQAAPGALQEEGSGEARAHEQMQQLLQYRILPDCLAVASATLGAAGAHAPLRQLGLDMLYRLNEHALIEQCLAEGRR